MKNPQIIVLGVLIFFCSCTPESKPPEQLGTSVETREVIVLSGDSFLPDYNFIYENFPTLTGTQVELTAFYDNTGDIPAGTIIMGREMTNCCSADTVLIGFFCRLPPEIPLPEKPGAWYRVKGALGSFLPVGYQEAVPVLNLSSLRAVEKPEFDLVYTLPMGLK